jgi:NAD(P)H-flavin reductase
MAFQSYRAVVDRIHDLTHDVREIDCHLIDPKEIVFKAGQFISFEIIPAEATRSVVRPYSIASPPQQDQVIRIVLNRVPGGIGSSFLFGLNPGDRLTFKGPVGSFYVRDLTRDLLFVATGTGIAPIRSMILGLLHHGHKGSIRLYWGLRSQRDLYYQEELERLGRQYPNFASTVTLSRPEGDWQGPEGRVTRLVEEGVQSVKNLAVYLCGNNAMIRDVTALINQKGLCPVYREIYYDDPGGKPDD